MKKRRKTLPPEIDQDAIKKSFNASVKGKRESRLESRLSAHMAFLGIEVEREYRFHPTRRWRFDFAIPDLKIGIECEGLVNPKFKSRHTTNSGFEKDCEKYNSAALRGWSVLRFTWGQIQSGYAIGMIERIIKLREVDQTRDRLLGGKGDEVRADRERQWKEIDEDLKKLRKELKR
jgi:very-short-patch-repair endonuclease